MTPSAMTASCLVKATENGKQKHMWKMSSTVPFRLQARMFSWCLEVTSTLLYVKCKHQKNNLLKSQLYLVKVNKIFKKIVWTGHDLVLSGDTINYLINCGKVYCLVSIFSYSGSLICSWLLPAMVNHHLMIFASNYGKEKAK